MRSSPFPVGEKPRTIVWLVVAIQFVVAVGLVILVWFELAVVVLGRNIQVDVASKGYDQQVQLLPLKAKVAPTPAYTGG
ncbi:hypothetical protein [Streptomyces sp. NPDC091299]|uniref:hypothetical protein n=1 Tax=Streptomyces sp. NPDC091299 TaxID=3155302 RepID=UPI003423EC0D